MERIPCEWLAVSKKVKEREYCTNGQSSISKGYDSSCSTMMAAKKTKKIMAMKLNINIP